jgi:hypothetical protein
MTASDWLMHGPFQGIQETPGYMRFVLPVREDRPATESSEPCLDDAAACTCTAEAAGVRGKERAQAGWQAGASCARY